MITDCSQNGWTVLTLKHNFQSMSKRPQVYLVFRTESWWIKWRIWRFLLSLSIAIRNKCFIVSSSTVFVDSQAHNTQNIITKSRIFAVVCAIANHVSFIQNSSVKISAVKMKIQSIPNVNANDNTWRGERTLLIKIGASESFKWAFESFSILLKFVLDLKKKLFKKWLFCQTLNSP